MAIDTKPLLPEMGAGERWRHDLRNRANSAMLATQLAKRQLERGETAAALENLGRAGEAFAALTELLNTGSADERHRG